MYHINYHSNIADLKAHYALLSGLHFETVKAAREYSEREAYKVMHTLHQECPGVLFDRSDTDRSVTIRLGKATCRWDIVEDGTEPTEVKFRGDPELLGKLLSTGTRPLVETNHWHDNFWGDCTCTRCANIRGKNMLGKLLMELRGSLLEYGKAPLQMPDPGFQGDVGFQMRQLAHGEFLDQPQQAGPVFRVAVTTYRLNWAAANLWGTDIAAARAETAAYLKLGDDRFLCGVVPGLSDIITVACVKRVSDAGAPEQEQEGGCSHV